MARQKKTVTIWTFGVTSTQEDSLRRLLGAMYQLQNWPVGATPSLADYENTLPGLGVFSPSAIKGLRKLPEPAVRHLALMPKVILLDEGYTLGDLEFAIDVDMTEIIRPPYTRAGVKDKIRRAIEDEAVHFNLLRMSREIALERELLERKNKTLHFLNDFVTSTSMIINPAELLEVVGEKIQALFPVYSLQAVIWDFEDAGSQTDVYISAPAGHEAFTSWLAVVREAVQKARPGLEVNFSVNQLCPNESKKAAPSDGHIITLPVSMGNRQFGMLLILTDTMPGLARDQAVALNSALRHLALTLKNARAYMLLKQQAELDGLTGVYNRRNFEQRIHDEVSRSLRYGHPLSLIFTDIDHFKKINDSRGHHAGDVVLKELASIFSHARRSSDYVARYGGEEFVIILPHTDIQQARIIAERLRQQVAEHNFGTGDTGNMRLTISQGIAELGAVTQKTAEALLNEADKAMYRAKSTGRDCIADCEINQIESELAV